MFLILVGVVVLLVVALTGNPSSPQVVRRTAVPQSVMDDLKVPSSAFAAAAASTTASSVTFTPPSVVTATPTLTSDGHPWVVYVGAEYCAFCAAERWPLIVALSRFGTFTRLSSMQSTPASVFPAIQGFTFVGSSYTSPYLSFSGIEEFSNVPSSDGSYSRLAVPPVGVRILQAR